jgi:Tfp pilus assembly protein FimT
MRVGLLVVAAIALIGFLAVAVVLPQMAGTEAREAAQALVSGADQAKAQVVTTAEKAGNLAGAGKDVKIAEKNDPKHGAMKWLVEEGGAIRGWNEKNAIEVALFPALQGGKVAWTCKGYPVSAMPQSCGGR